MGLQPSCLPGPRDVRETGEKPPVAAAVEPVQSRDRAPHMLGADWGPLGIPQPGGEEAMGTEAPGTSLSNPAPPEEHQQCLESKTNSPLGLSWRSVGKTPRSQCRGPRFDPWSGN